MYENTTPLSSNSTSQDTVLHDTSRSLPPPNTQTTQSIQNTSQPLPPPPNTQDTNLQNVVLEDIDLSQYIGGNNMTGGGFNYIKNNYYEFNKLDKDNKLVDKSMIDTFEKKNKKTNNKIIYDFNMEGYNNNNYFKLN